MKLQFVNILKDGTADIFLFEEIGGPNGISGAQVAEEMKFLNEVQNVKAIRIHINSPGGIVQDGLSIIGAMRASKAPVDTIAAGIAASISGIIFLHGRKRSMNDFGRLMIHAPSLQGEENGKFLNDRDKEALSQVQDMLAIQLENNSNKSKTDILSLMEREIWVNADLALTWGLIDEIINTERKSALIGNSIAEIHNSAADILNDYKSPKTKTMKTVTNHLKLNDDANEENVLQAIQNIETEASEAKTTVSTQEQTIADLEAENAELKTKVESLEGEAVTNNDTVATEFIENCIKEGKFNAEDKENLVAKAKADLDGFKTIANLITIGTAHVDITNELGTAPLVPSPAMGLREMEKKDPSKVLEIRDKNPDLYEKMHEDQYSVKLSLN